MYVTIDEMRFVFLPQAFEHISDNLFSFD